MSTEYKTEIEFYSPQLKTVARVRVHLKDGLILTACYDIKEGCEFPVEGINQVLVWEEMKRMIKYIYEEKEKRIPLRVIEDRLNLNHGHKRSISLYQKILY